MNYDLDLKAFWEENKKCFKAFSTDKPRVPLSFWLDDHFVFGDMKPPSTIRYYKDYDYRKQLNKEHNKLLLKELGKTFHNEDDEPRLEPNRFEVIMGSYWEILEGGTPWLESKVRDVDDLKELIKRAQKIDMNEAAFPEGWVEEKSRFEKSTGKRLKLGGSASRGPATMATSILGTVNTCMFMMEEPEIMDEFFMTLAQNLVEYHKVLMKNTGHDTREGYVITDDNCYLFPPAKYERFCAPVLQKLFSEFAPQPHHKRYQHSDSDMKHLMKILSWIGVNEVNLGPTIDIRDIRRDMPNALIYGNIPPFTLKDGSPEDIIKAVRYDIESVGQDGGLVECPAGSVVEGTPYQNLRAYMWAVHTYGRY